MSLRNIKVKDHYRSDRNNLVDDFYIPCLLETSLYSRAVGYFSSTSIIAVSQGLAGLIDAGGKMRLIASPNLSSQDIQAINTGLKQREEVINRAILEEFKSVSHDRLACLSWLLSHGVLDIKLAVPKNLGQGIYHEKIGILTDRGNNQIAFSGSANETQSGLINNFERIEVFCSWQGDENKRVKRIAKDFEKLWKNETRNVEILDFPEAANRKLLQYCPYDKPTINYSLQVSTKTNLVAEASRDYKIDNNNTVGQQKSIHNLDITLRDYQEKALYKFKDANYQGILAMATGAGKTITALACASMIEDLDLIIIAVPIKDLVRQWMDELDKLTDFYYPVPAMGNSQKWRDILYRKLNLIHGNIQKIKRLPTVVVGTYKGLSDSVVAELIEDAKGLPEKSLIIADEVHNAGGKTYRNILRDDFTYRLGLSATPIRPYDEEGTEFVLDYFGGLIYEFSLEEAIKRGILCQYNYYVYIVYLTELENDRYKELTSKLTKLRHSKKSNKESRIKKLTIQRSKLIKSAYNKITILNTIIQDHQLHKGMVYCADIDQTDIVCRRLAQQGVSVARYSSRDGDKQRKLILEQFDKGYIQGLVAVKCLDEGVNIPAALEAIILASDTSKRQFIQRRGRILRAAKGKAIATLIDLLVVPPIVDDEVKLISSEVKRIKHFIKSANNRGSVITQLVGELSHYGISYSDLIE